MYNEDQKIGFRFSPDLDNAFLQELYGDDLQQAEMVFESSVQQLRNGKQLTDARFHEGDMPGLKKEIHKLKPLLGYMGMNKIMGEFEEFEQACAQFSSSAEAEDRFENIKALMLEAIKKAEKEINRLNQHNTQCL